MLHLHMMETSASALAPSHDQLSFSLPPERECTAARGETPRGSCLVMPFADYRPGRPVLHVLLSELLIVTYSVV